jgi:hypothetical protein
MSFQVLSPDGLPLDPMIAGYPTRESADRAVLAFCERFTRQGYYAAATGRIPLLELPARCTVTEIAADLKVSVTAGRLLDILERAHVVLREDDDHADENVEIIEELSAVQTLLRREIEGSHMGVGADVVLIGAQPTATLTDGERCDRVTTLLRDRYHIAAYSEHTGGGIMCVLIPDGEARGTWYWGMGDANWSGGCVAFDHGDMVEGLDVLTTDVPSDTDDVERVALAIANTMGAMRGTPMMQPGLMTDVCHYLRTEWIVRATHEFPGYISIPVPAHLDTPPHVWACGTDNNERWEAQLQDESGAHVFETRVTTVPATTDNAYVIAKALADAIGLERG